MPPVGCRVAHPAGRRRPWPARWWISRWVRTLEARCACRRVSAGSTACGQRTAGFRWTACCSRLRPSTPSAGSRGTRRPSPGSGQSSCPDPHQSLVPSVWLSRKTHSISPSRPRAKRWRQFSRKLARCSPRRQHCDCRRSAWRSGRVTSRRCRAAKRGSRLGTGSTKSIRHSASRFRTATPWLAR